MSEQKQTILSASVREKIDRWLEKFPAENKRSASLYSLRVVQDENNGWLSEELMDAVAEYLELPKIAIYEVATFYSMYDLKPVGRHKINVCNSIACMLRGSNQIIEHIEKKLNIKVGETSSDGCFILKEAECLAACGGAPMMQVDYQQYHENLTIEKVDAILDEIKRKETSHG